VARLILVRHPEVEDPRVISGQSEVRLSERGEASIPGIVAALPKATRVVASDLLRCRVLAETLARRDGLPVELDPRWREQSFGVFEGRTWGNVDGRAYLASWLTASVPGGESLPKVVERVREAMRDLADGTVVIAHAGPIRCALSLARGLPLEEAFAIAVPFGGVQELG